MQSSQLSPIPMNTCHSLLRPLEVHPRWGGEDLFHSLPLLREGGPSDEGRCGHLGGKCILSLVGSDIPHKQFLIYDT